MIPAEFTPKFASDAAAPCVCGSTIAGYAIAAPYAVDVYCYSCHQRDTFYPDRPDRIKSAAEMSRLHRASRMARH